MRHVGVLVLAAGLVLGGVSPSSAEDIGHAARGDWGLETQYVDPAVKAGDDFYKYVNGLWLKTAKIPSGFADANAFVDASLQTEHQLDALIAEIVASNPAPGSDAALVKAVYASYSNVERLDALGYSAIAADVAKILAVDTYEQAAAWMADPFAPSVISAYVQLDPGQPKRYVARVGQSGLGLPSREYYLLAEEPFAGHRVAYRDFIESTFRRAGIDHPRRRADSILALETAIAKAQWTPTEQRDPVRMYHLMTVDALARYAPGFAWTAFLDAKGFGDQSEIVVETDTAVKALAALFADTPIETWRSYLAFHYIDAMSDYMASAWQQAHFDFYSRRLQGITQRRPLKERAINIVSDFLGEPLGHAYVDRYFPPEYRAQMETMVANLRAAFHTRIERNAWMDEATRTEALAKLEGVTSHIAYPDRWRDYSALRLDPGDLIGNARAIVTFEEADALAALKGPRREWQWSYSPQTVNAGYAPDLNSITFPAAILQPPFFDPHADPAVNYGAIGAVIGHELGHAFDDQGSQSDADGALRNWWSDASRREFETRVKVLIDQFDAFTPIEGMYVNGALTLGENIGDLGGLTVAYDAYHLSLRPAVNAPTIDGFTGDQRFFMAWAQVWRELSTPDAVRQQLLSDPHSPGEFRANGAVRNVDAWYTAFGVAQGDALYLAPDKRAKIW